MEALELLPVRLLLLAASPETGRLPAQTRTRELMAMAALGELWLAGCIVDDRGRVARAKAPAPDWPPLAPLLGEIERSSRRRWHTWAQRPRGLDARTRDTAIGAGLALHDQRRLLGVPYRRFVVTALGARKALLAEALGWLAADAPVEGIPPKVGLTIALADAARLTTVLDRSLRRAHGDRLDALRDRYAPLPRALRTAISRNDAAG